MLHLEARIGPISRGLPPPWARSYKNDRLIRDDSRSMQIPQGTGLMAPCGNWPGTRFGRERAKIVEEGGYNVTTIPLGSTRGSHR
jgi:hypothetical protein